MQVDTHSIDRCFVLFVCLLCLGEKPGPCTCEASALLPSYIPSPRGCSSKGTERIVRECVTHPSVSSFGIQMKPT